MATDQASTNVIGISHCSCCAKKLTSAHGILTMNRRTYKVCRDCVNVMWGSKRNWMHDKPRRRWWLLWIR